VIERVGERVGEVIDAVDVSIDVRDAHATHRGIVKMDDRRVAHVESNFYLYSSA